ncbi:hypothetical protein [Arthrobacter sp. TE12232]
MSTTTTAAVTTTASWAAPLPHPVADDGRQHYCLAAVAVCP